jgi:hypothetical protein
MIVILRCPDCTRAEPIINEVLGNVNCLLLECNVIREEYKDFELYDNYCYYFIDLVFL